MSNETDPAEEKSEETVADADWGAAMSEQMAAEVGAAAESHKTPEVFNEFVGNNKPNELSNDIEFILDIPVQLTVELGRTKIAIKNLLQLAQGSVVELDGMAGEPMGVLVNGCMVAQGEVVVVNDKFGIRLTDIITPSERIKKLNK
jgi:flagellar motor switch protein FliN/FliY